MRLCSTCVTRFPAVSPVYMRFCAARTCFEGRWCLDPHEDLSPGQMEEIDRVCQSYLI
jgi:hypothetical protein